MNKILCTWKKYSFFDWIQVSEVFLGVFEYNWFQIYIEFPKNSFQGSIFYVYEQQLEKPWIFKLPFEITETNECFSE